MTDILSLPQGASDEWDDCLARPPTCHATVEEDYLAANDDELSLRKGERVAVHSKDETKSGDCGWWLGVIGHRVGVFPMNYVRVDEDGFALPTPTKTTVASRRNSTTSNSQHSDPTTPTQSSPPFPSPPKAARDELGSNTPGRPAPPPPLTATSSTSAPAAGTAAAATIAGGGGGGGAPASSSVLPNATTTSAKTGSAAGGAAAALALLEEESETDVVEAAVRMAEIPYDSLRDMVCIGAGGFGRVYRAKYRGKHVAVKAFTVEGLSAKEAENKLQDLQMEGELLAGCAHRNVCRLFGAASRSPDYCLVMEFCAGGALSSTLQNCRLAPAVIIDWATQIARGMNYLHYEGPVAVIHRDLKSCNILLSMKEQEDGVIGCVGNVLKIADFGLARKFVATTRMTQEGTYAWMAPEVIRTSTFSMAADVWSFGVLMWELLTSQIPYHGIHFMTVAYNVAIKGCTLPIPTDTPRSYAALVRQCWDTDPHTRPSFQTILALLQQDGAAEFEDSETFEAQQDAWRSSIDIAFKQLERSEKEIQVQREELEQLLDRQQDKAKQLDEKERQLAEREAQLQRRELAAMLVAGTVEPRRPVRRNSHRIKKQHGTSTRLRKEDIGTPSGFRQVLHVGIEHLQDTEAVEALLYGRTVSLPNDPGYRSRLSRLPSVNSNENLGSSLPLGVAGSRTTSPAVGGGGGGGGGGGAGGPGLASTLPSAVRPLSPATPSRAQGVSSPTHTAAGSKASTSSSSSTTTGPQTSPLSQRHSPPKPFIVSNPVAIVSPPHAFTNPVAHRSNPSPPVVILGSSSPTFSPPSVLAPGSVPSAHAWQCSSCARISDSFARCRHCKAPRPPKRDNPPSVGRGVLVKSMSFSGAPHPPSNGPAAAAGLPAAASPPWFRPELQKEDAIRLLRAEPVGTFLVRGAPSHAGSLTLSVVQPDGVIAHASMVHSTRGWRLSEAADLFFSSVGDLIEHYHRFPYVTLASGRKLCLQRQIPSSPPDGRPRSQSQYDF